MSERSTALSSDVVVVGCGIAGMMAAVRASELGLRVIALEQGGDAQYLCNSRYTGGVFHVAFNDIYAAPAVLYDAILGATNGFAGQKLARALADDALRPVKWLEKQGIRFVSSGAYPWQSAVMAPPGIRGPGLHWQGRGGDATLRTLAERLRALGGQMMLGTRASELTLADGHCTGLVATQGGATIRLAAGAVVLADGGFQGNPDMVRRYLSQHPERLRQRGAGTGKGDGIRMAEAAGAKLVGMDRFYGHVQCRDAMQNDELWPYPILDHLLAACIVVDDTGKRFFDEGLGGVYAANAIGAHKDPLSATLVFDEAIWEGPGSEYLIAPNPNLAQAGGTVHRAATLGELAAKAGIAADTLAATVSGYNDAVHTGKLKALSPGRSDKLRAPMAILRSPYYAIQACAGITYTMGGLLTDEHGQVVHGTGRTIAGLFAAGSTTGGIEGGPQAGYTGGLAKAACFALRAAERIAALAAK